MDSHIRAAHLPAPLQQLVVDGDGRHEGALTATLGLADGKQACKGDLVSTAVDDDGDCW